MDWEFGVSKMQAITFRMEKQCGPTIHTGNYIQSPGIDLKRKEYKKECVFYIYVCVYIYEYKKMYIYMSHCYIAEIGTL